MMTMQKGKSINLKIWVLKQSQEESLMKARQAVPLAYIHAQSYIGLHGSDEKLNKKKQYESETSTVWLQSVLR